MNEIIWQVWNVTLSEKEMAEEYVVMLDRASNTYIKSDTRNIEGKSDCSLWEFIQNVSFTKQIGYVFYR
jgi:hypothetical protein